MFAILLSIRYSLFSRCESLTKGHTRDPAELQKCARDRLAIYECDASVSLVMIVFASILDYCSCYISQRGDLYRGSVDVKDAPRRVVARESEWKEQVRIAA